MTVNREEMSGHDAVVLTPTDELLTAEVVQTCEGIADSSATKHVIIAFRSIRSLVSSSLYPDAAPFTPLVNLHQMLLQSERKLVLCNLSNEISDVFRITRLDQIFEIQPDVDSALSSMSINSQ